MTYKIKPADLMMIRVLSSIKVDSGVFGWTQTKVIFLQKLLPGKYVITSGISMLTHDAEWKKVPLASDELIIDDDQIFETIQEAEEAWLWCSLAS